MTARARRTPITKPKNSERLPAGVTIQDMQWVESRKFKRPEIIRVYLPRGRHRGLGLEWVSR